MKIGVLSDTHIPVVAESIPEVVIGTFKREGVSLIVHCGDIVEETVIFDLMEIAPVKAVCGNMDRPSVRNNYPDVETFEVEGVKFLVTHGWGDAQSLPDRIYQSYASKGVDVILFGHSHRPCNMRREGVLLFNPGSPTDTFYTPRRSFGILEVKEGSVSGSIIFID